MQSYPLIIAEYISVTYGAFGKIYPFNDANISNDKISNKLNLFEY